ncbi:hypothetical protein [Streptomyces sp.]|uniref:hypothetical protein n=1 Tax=Streptomyces sp. TaxID=1931 RepID=UPI002F41A195
MSWNKLSKAQQNYARRLRDRLWEAGLTTSVSQIAARLDDAAEWDRGDLTLEELCARTGWEIPAK